MQSKVGVNLAKEEYRMSDTTCEDEKEQKLDDDHDPKNDEQFLEDSKNSASETQDPLPCPEQEGETIKKKYGGLVPKKPPLIAKDHDHAFFDSADWALGKQGSQKSKGPLETLRPKLQPTHQQIRSRRSPYASADDVGSGEEGNDGINDKCSPPEEVQSKTLDGSPDDNFHLHD